MHYSILTHLDLHWSNNPSILQPENLDCSVIHSQFEEVMMRRIDDMMKPYDENTEDTKLLEFEDMSEYIHKEYRKGGTEVIRYSNGSIVSIFERQFSEKYTVQNGVVFQRDSGQLHHLKRSKKAKRFQVLPCYPFHKIYPSLYEFAKAWYGYEFDAQHRAYGYYSNPNGYYDWYEVGGRWPDRLLISTDDPYYVSGEKSWTVDDEVKEAPDGYRWVTGARKSAIQWELMRSIAVKQATELYHKLEQWFTIGAKPEDLDDSFYLREDSIVQWGNVIRKMDTTLEQFLQDRGLAPEQRFLISSIYIINQGSWECQNSHRNEPDNNEVISWDQYMAQYLDELQDDAFIVTLDCHN